MNKFNIIILLVILFYALIQLIEVSSFFARYSGVLLGKKTLAYALQNAVFMLTRFFTMALLPMLGLLIDIGVDKHDYLLMVSGSYIISGLLCSILIVYRNKVIAAFTVILNDISLNKSLLLSIIKYPIYLFSKDLKKINVILPSISSLFTSRIFWLSALVFSIYALSVFMVFYISLSFPQYRASISQLSGVTNAFATILLTFIVEPKISLAIDSNELEETALSMIFALILGRVFGVSILAQIFILVVVAV